MCQIFIFCNKLGTNMCLIAASLEMMIGLLLLEITSSKLTIIIPMPVSANTINITTMPHKPSMEFVFVLEVIMPLLSIKEAILFKSL